MSHYVNSFLTKTNFQEYQDPYTRERSLVPAKSKKQNYLELRELVRLYQLQDEIATKELCNRFQGLIAKHCKSSMVQEFFAEDSENILWELFLDIVSSLDVENTKRIAGYIEEALHNKLINEMKKLTKPYEQVSYETCEEQGIQLADTEDGYLAIFTNATLETAIKSLESKDERILIRKHYGEDLSLAACSELLGRSYKATAKLKYKCIKKLRKVLTYELSSW